MNAFASRALAAGPRSRHAIPFRTSTVRKELA